jgi:hypothetical protein
MARKYTHPSPVYCGAVETEARLLRLKRRGRDGAVQLRTHVPLDDDQR